MSAVRQFRAEGERPLKVPSPPAPTAVFTGVRGRAGPAQQAESDYITALFNYHRSLVSLEAAVGRRLR